MSSTQATVWKEAPELAIPDSPAIFCDSSNLWLAYKVAPTSSERYAIIRFVHVIDHRLSPINDEGLGKHFYIKAGLKWYTFHELTESLETVQWSALKAGTGWSHSRIIRSTLSQAPQRSSGKICRRIIQQRLCLIFYARAIVDPGVPSFESISSRISAVRSVADLGNAAPRRSRISR